MKIRLTKALPDDGRVPRGYDNFTSRWNEGDPDRPYKFCTYDPISRVVTVMGKSLPLKELLSAALQKPAPSLMVTMAPSAVKNAPVVGAHSGSSQARKGNVSGKPTTGPFDAAN